MASNAKFYSCGSVILPVIALFIEACVAEVLRVCLLPLFHMMIICGEQKSSSSQPHWVLPQCARLMTGNVREL